MLYACDGQWWDDHKGAADFSGLRVTQDAGAVQRWPGLQRVPSENGDGLSLDPHRIHQGDNSGFQAINLAVLLGVRRILLLGYDMKPGPKGEIHHHPDHKGRLHNPSAGTMTKWIPRFAEMLPGLRAAQVEIINCTRDTALTCFPRIALSEVLP